MIREGCLSKYRLVLTARSPVFIGSGQEVNKKEYCYDERKNLVRILNPQRFIELIASPGLAEAYEAFILRNPYGYLDRFLRDNQVTDSEIASVTDFTIDSADALTEGNSLNGIKLFMRNAHNNLPYIPGSSLKGALRTVLLLKMINDTDNREVLKRDFLAKTEGQPRYRNNYAKEAAALVETAFLHSLNCKDNKNDAINSLMRGISVSDSSPILQKDAMILCGKKDLSVAGEIKSINTVSECIRPNVEIEFGLTLDSAIIKEIDADYIRAAIREFGASYAENFDRRFKKPKEAVTEGFYDAIILGGGAGFFSKTFVYQLLGYQEGLTFVSRYMSEKFCNHKHDKDAERGVSPHCLKYTLYNGRYYHFGVCSVEIN